MREIQGAIIMASLFQIILGFCGIFGYIMQRISPITLSAAVMTIGFSLFKVATRFASKDWTVAAITTVLIIIFSQYLRNVGVPIPFTQKKNGGREGRKRFPLFQLFPVLLAIIITWTGCAILSAIGTFQPGHSSHGLVKWDIVRTANYFRVPYPMQWGTPTFSASSSVGFLSAILAGVVESLGEYRAIARIVGAPKPATHAINRGVFMEGLGCVLMGLFGTGTGTTSYSENTGALSVTGVGSRRVVQAAGVIMIIFSLFSVVGAFFLSLPDPIIGGVLYVTFSMIVAVGLANLQNVDLNSTRNVFIVGFSVFSAMGVSTWMEDEENSRLINTGVAELDNTIRVFLTTAMFIAAVVSFLLDNTIPGSKMERGVLLLESQTDDNNYEQINVTYNLPFGMEFLQRYSKITSLFPILPTFKGFGLAREEDNKVPLDTMENNAPVIN